MPNPYPNLTEAERCTSLIEEWGTKNAKKHVRRSWRCEKPADHVHGTSAEERKHRSYGGHRSWK